MTENIILASMANAAASSLIYPLTKLRMMLILNYGRYPPNTSEHFIDIVVKTVRSRHPTDFYRGFAASVAKQAPLEGLQFALKERVKPFMARKFGARDTSSIFSRFASNFAAGGLTGVCFWIPLYPLDLLRVRLSGHLILSRGNQLASFSEHTWEIIKKEGVSELYRGFSISAARDLIFRGLYFGLYDTLFPLSGIDYGFPLKLIAAHMIVSLGLLLSNPFEMVRRQFVGSAMITKDSVRWPNIGEIVRRFRKEMKFTAALRHPHNVPFAGYGLSLTLVFFDELKRTFGSQILVH